MNQTTIFCSRFGPRFLIEVVKGDCVSFSQTYPCRDTFRSGLAFVKFCYPTARIGSRRTSS